MGKLNKDDDLQLRVREIDNGYLVLNGPSTFFCDDIDGVMDRLEALLRLGSPSFGRDK